MESFSALLVICAGNSPVTREFPTQRPVTRSFDAFFDLRLNKRLSKQWWCQWSAYFVPNNSLDQSRVVIVYTYIYIYIYIYMDRISL